MARQKPPTDSQRARRARELANRKVVLKAREDVRVVEEQRRVEAAATRDAVRLVLVAEAKQKRALAQRAAHAAIQAPDRRK